MAADNIDTFIPPQRILMGPGPSNIHPRVLKAMSEPVIGYMDPIFVQMMAELKELIRYLPGFRTWFRRDGKLFRQPRSAW